MIIKKQKKKGFTLIELLGVLVVLVTIVLVAIPSITSTIERNKNRIKEQKKAMIVSAAEVYVTKYKEEFNYEKFLAGNCGISINSIKYKKIITDDELKDSSGNDIFDDSSKVLYNYSEGTYNITTSEEVSECGSCFVLSDNTIIRYECFDSDVINELVIPNEINGVEITAIGDEVFLGNNIKSVTIPHTIREIGDRAFAQCHLETLNLFNAYGLQTIGESAFEYNDLVVVHIPPDVTSIGSFAFSENELLKDVYIYDDVSIGENALGRTTSLKNIYNYAGISLDWGNIIFGNSSGVFASGCALSGEYRNLYGTNCHNIGGVFVGED